jgi:CspA family cold shock protein
MTRGVVKFFKAEKGWGAITADGFPPGQDVWVHYSAIEATGYRALSAGDVVEFDYERGRQDSFNYRATRARHVEPGPAPTLRRVDGKVVTVPDGTPDTPLTPRRQR